MTRALSRPTEEGMSWKRSKWIRQSGRDAILLGALLETFRFAVARMHASQLVVSWPLIRTPYVSDINRSRASWPIWPHLRCQRWASASRGSRGVEEAGKAAFGGLYSMTYCSSL